jgi:hypothetical protein
VPENTPAAGNLTHIGFHPEANFLGFNDLPLWPGACSFSQYHRLREWAMNTLEATGAKNFMIWMAIWLGALMVLLPALSGQ